jgi:hypothetical protein
MDMDITTGVMCGMNRSKAVFKEQLSGNSNRDIWMAGVLIARRQFRARHTPG